MPGVRPFGVVSEVAKRDGMREGRRTIPRLVRVAPALLRSGPSAFRLRLVHRSGRRWPVVHFGKNSPSRCEKAPVCTVEKVPKCMTPFLSGEMWKRIGAPRTGSAEKRAYRRYFATPWQKATAMHDRRVWSSIRVRYARSPCAIVACGGFAVSPCAATHATQGSIVACVAIWRFHAGLPSMVESALRCARFKTIAYAKISFSTTRSFLILPTSFCSASMTLGRMSPPMSTYISESPTLHAPSLSHVRT